MEALTPEAVRHILDTSGRHVRTVMAALCEDRRDVMQCCRSQCVYMHILVRLQP